MTKAKINWLRNLRYGLWGMVVIAAIGAATLYFTSSAGRAVGVNPGQFSLTATDGSTFTEADLKGTPSLVFFGYTYCPDVCPTTLAETAGWRQSLGLTPDQLRLIFVTVDPDRDDLDGLKSYLAAFDTPIIGLRGTEAETANAKKVFGVQSEKVDDAGSTDYLVNHTASVFLLDENGRFEGTIAYGEARTTAIGKISKLLGI